MKSIFLAVIIGLFSQLALAIQLPDELSPAGLPPAIPCKMNKFVATGAPDQDALLCAWMAYPRTLTEWDPQQNRNVSYSNRKQGVCRKGTCRVKGHVYGFLPMDVTFLVSNWYYIGLSTDGKPVAYLFDTGPGYGGEAVSYVQAGQYVVELYENGGMDDRSRVLGQLELLYEGGSKQFQKDLAGDSTATDSPAADFGEIKEAWCNPRMDDDCSINGNPVPKADLPKYLPLLDPDVVKADGGGCEIQICYSAEYKPIGVSKNHYK